MFSGYKVFVKAPEMLLTIIPATTTNPPAMATAMTYASTSAYAASAQGRCASLGGPSGDQFAFARVNGDICLVQIPLTDPSTASAALSAVDVKFFRHELITIFRYSHCDTLHPADIRILEAIDDRHTRYEEETGCVFLAKDIMDRLRKMTEKRESMTRRPSQLRRWS